MEQIENGMLTGGCIYCGKYTKNSDNICNDCIDDIRIAEKLENEIKDE